MATIRANAAFDSYRVNFLPLAEDVTSRQLIKSGVTRIAGQDYPNALAIEFWDSSFAGGDGSFPTSLRKTVLGGTGFALSADKQQMDGTIKAITQFGDGATISDYSIVGLNVSANALLSALAGGGGQAQILLFAGNDRFFLSSSSDAVSAGAGNDTVYAGAGNDTVYGDSGDDVLLGEAGLDTLYGDYGQDSLYGGAGNDLLLASHGTDLIDGGSGRDTFSLVSFLTGVFTVDLRIAGPQTFGADAQATLSNIESVAGSLAKDTLIGNDLSNSLSGDSGNDTLIGNKGADWLQGGAGADTLTGGAGADRFFFADIGYDTNSRDKITDFSRAEGDRIALPRFPVTGLYDPAIKQLDFGSFYAGRSATKAQDASDRIIYNTKSGVLFFDPDGTGAESAVAIATLTNADGSHPDLAYTDFLLI